MIEVWKALEQASYRYQVSNLGRIKRLEFSELARFKSGIIRKTFKPEKLISGVKLSKKGYVRVNLLTGVKQVHVLVALTFLGPKPSPKHQVNHKNGIKTDNRVENLEWVTNKENRTHAVRLGLQASRKAGNLGKISNKEIKIILNQLNEGKTQKSIATLYGVCQQTISKIYLKAKS